MPGNTLHALAQGQYDICLTTVVHYLKMLSSKPDIALRFIFMSSPRSHMALYVARPGALAQETLDGLGNMAYVGSEDSPAACEPRPNYRRFARELTCEYLALRQRLGITEPAEIVDVPFDDVFPRLVAGDGEVVVDWIDEVPRRRDAVHALGGEVSAVPFLDAPGGDIYAAGFVARASFVTARPDLVERFCTALREAMEETRDDPAPAQAAMARYVPHLNLRHVIEVWRLLDRVVFGGEVGAMDWEGWDRTIEHHAAFHGTKRFPLEMVCAADRTLTVHSSDDAQRRIKVVWGSTG